MELAGMTDLTITVLCYLVGRGLKTWKKFPDEWIPVLVGMTGAVLGMGCFLMNIPDFPGTNPIYAACIGGASGLAAVGIHQIGKQMDKFEDL